MALLAVRVLLGPRGFRVGKTIERLQTKPVLRETLRQSTFMEVDGHEMKRDFFGEDDDSSGEEGLAHDMTGVETRDVRKMRLSDVPS